MRLITAFLVTALALAVTFHPAWSQGLPAPARFITAQTTVATSATLVAPSRPTRHQIQIITTGTNQVTCGPTNAVTAGNGAPINPTANSSLSFNTTAEVWCIAAANQAVATLETYQ